MAASSDSTSAVALDGGYWTQSRQPLASLLFVAPILVAYEAGIIALGPYAARNGADVWLRLFLDWLGFGQYFLLPILTVCLLLGWHHTTHQPWRLPRGIFWGMAVECVLMAFCLRMVLQMEAILFQGLDVAAAMQAPSGLLQYPVQIIKTRIGYLGAGIYEELLFRLILLSFVLWAFHCFSVPRAGRVLLAVLLTSLLFSAAHYVGGRETVLWFSFLFRFLAGVFFAVLFLYRGFGIAVGAHAGYDLLVGLL